MIPEFPNFKKLELEDKIEVEKFTTKFPPYSDFNFASMWSWNVHDQMALSRLNGNLVVVFEDYVYLKPFLSVIGENNIKETALELLAFSERNYHYSSLKLIPEEVAADMPDNICHVQTDRDSYDYVYSISHLANMNNWSNNSSGKKIRKFLRSGIKYTVKHSSILEINKDEYMQLFRNWAGGKKIDNHFELNEYLAFERFLQIKDKNIKFVSLYIEGSLAGFTAHEITSNDFALSHFAKVDLLNFKLAGDLLNWEEAKLLQARRVKYFNWEQDLGIPGLRYAKEKYKHTFFLKKFTVKKVEDYI